MLIPDKHAVVYKQITYKVSTCRSFPVSEWMFIKVKYTIIRKSTNFFY